MLPVLGVIRRDEQSKPAEALKTAPPVWLGMLSGALMRSGLDPTYGVIDKPAYTSGVLLTRLGLKLGATVKASIFDLQKRSGHNA